MKTAYIEVRSQKSIGSGSGRFGGPDSYVMVQVVPEGVERLKSLQHRAAENRGITLHYIGEGYSCNKSTTRSMMGRALAEAKVLADNINSGDLP